MATVENWVSSQFSLSTVDKREREQFGQIIADKSRLFKLCLARLHSRLKLVLFACLGRSYQRARRTDISYNLKSNGSWAQFFFCISSTGYFLFFVSFLLSFHFMFLFLHLFVPIGFGSELELYTLQCVVVVDFFFCPKPRGEPEEDGMEKKWRNAHQESGLSRFWFRFVRVPSRLSLISRALEWSKKKTKVLVLPAFEKYRMALLLLLWSSLSLSTLMSSLLGRCKNWIIKMR